MTKVRVRRLKKGDARALLAFYNGRGEASRRTFAPLGQETTLEVCQGIVDDNTSAGGAGVSLVAVDGAEIVGWGFIYKMDIDEPTLGLAVADAYRGQGIGSALMARVLDVARELGLSQVELIVVQDNEIAQRLYTRCGFVRCGECIGKDGLSYFQMRKEITMRDYQIACAQFNAAPGAKDKNIARMILYMGEARDQGCDLVLFPELIVTSYLAADQIPPLVEPVDGPSVERLAQAARMIDINVAFGFAELDATRQVCHNSMVVLDRQGQVAGVYRKIHLWGKENDWAKPGSKVPLFELDGVRFSGWICYDTRFPEVARAAAVAGADVALVPTAWLGPVDEWQLALRARALDNSIFVAGADIINPDPQLLCKGASLIAGPKGHVLAQAELEREGIIIARLSGDVLEYQRKRVALLENRRYPFSK